MLVFGDKAENLQACSALAAAEGIWNGAERASGPDRHAKLISAFIALAELVQGLGDAAFEAAGCDELDHAVEPGMRLLEATAREVMRSWDGGLGQRAGAAATSEIAEGFRRLRMARLPAAVRCKQAEGFAFYALYPETYALAAR